MLGRRKRSRPRKEFLLVPEDGEPELMAQRHLLFGAGAHARDEEQRVAVTEHGEVVGVPELAGTWHDDVPEQGEMGDEGHDEARLVEAGADLDCRVVFSTGSGSEYGPEMYTNGNDTPTRLPKAPVNLARSPRDLVRQ